MEKALRIIIPMAGWFAVIAQFILMINNRVASVDETIIRYFSFFTILTNLLVAFVFTKETNSVVKPGLIAATTVYISIVGLVYQILLRHIWNPTGLQMLVDELLHS